MLDYTQLQTLAVLLRKGSFEATATALNVTQSAVSQRIRQLEDRIGTPLVLRGQPCTGTDMGLRLARHVEEVALLEQQVTGSKPDMGARLRIAVNADSLATWVLEALSAHADLSFDVVVDDQDHSLSWLKRGEVSAAVTASPTPPQGCQAIALGAMRYQATASPEFVQKHLSRAVDKYNIQTAPMLVFNTKDKLQHIWIEENFKVIHRGIQHFIPSTEGFVEAQLRHMGWGLNPAHLVTRELAEGRLVQLLPGRDLHVPLFWQFSRLMERALTPITASILRVSGNYLHR